MSTATAENGMTVELYRFMRLAMRGKHRGASGGEKRCFKLAEAILENVCGLDDQAISGLEQFIRVAQMRPEATRDAMEMW